MSKKGPLDYQLNTTLGSNKINVLNSFIDPLLVISICTVLVFGLFILYSASGQSKTMVSLQAIYIGFGLIFKRMTVAMQSACDYAHVLKSKH